MKNLWPLLALAILAFPSGASAQASPASPSAAGSSKSPEADIGGVYDFEAGTPGGKRGGRLVIHQTAGQYSGSIAPDGSDPAPITRVTNQGSDVTIEAAIASGANVVLKLQARADSLVGTYQLTGATGESGDIRAVRIRK